MSWFQFLYLAVGCACAVTAGVQVEKVNFWAILLVILLWPMALTLHLFTGKKR